MKMFDMGEIQVIDEIAEFLAFAAPEKILAYHPSDLVQKRFEDLVWKKKEGVIAEKENEELEYYFMLEHIFRLAKAHAAIQIAQ